MMRRSSLLLRFGWGGASGASKSSGGSEERRYDDWEETRNSSKEGEEQHEDNHGETSDMPAAEYMKLAEAYKLFGYGMNDNITRDELKKRFRKLTLKYHPDQGGDHETFQKLIEAHKILESVRHDKADVSSVGTKKRSKAHFHKQTFDDMTNTPHRATMDDLLNFDYLDIFLCACLPLAVLALYCWHDYDRGIRLIRARGRLREDEMLGQEEEANKAQHKWHAWRSTNAEKDELAYIQEVYQPDLSQTQRSAQSPFSVSGGPGPAAKKELPPQPTGYVACAQRMTV